MDCDLENNFLLFKLLCTWDGILLPWSCVQRGLCVFAWQMINEFNAIICCLYSAVTYFVYTAMFRCYCDAFAGLGLVDN